MSIYLLLSILASSTRLTIEEVPQYPESVLRHAIYHSRENLEIEYWLILPDGITFQEAGDHAVKIARGYLQQLEKHGWVLLAENRQQHGGRFRLRKQIIMDLEVDIGAAKKPIEGKMKDHAFIRLKLKRRIPFEDITGCDPPDVPRYPNCIRIRWMNLLGGFAVKYLTLDDPEKVKTFFKKEVPAHGWETSRGVGTLNYQKGGKVPGPEEIAPNERLGRTTKTMIPTTLSIKISENDGITEIGIGRTRGSDDTVKTTELPITPPKEEIKKKEVLTTIKMSEIPVYNGLVKKWGREIPVDLQGDEQTMIRYEMKAGSYFAIKIASFYLNEMRQRGWRLVDDEWYGLGRKMRFKKGAVGVKIEIKAVGLFPIPEKAPEINIPVEIVITRPIPLKDVAGEDVKNVPRFPGSVRFYYLKAGIDQIVKFKAVGSVEEAEWFFIEKLPGAGWTFAGNDKTGLLFIPSSFARSATKALSSGKLIPTTLKVKVDDQGDGIVKIGMDLTKGD